MNTSDTTNSQNDGGFISFSNDNSTPNRRKTPFKSPHHNFQEQFSSPQGFSSPIFNNQRNFNGNRRQGGNSYGGERFRGNQSYNRGNNWKNRNDNRKPYNNRSFNKNGSGTVDISDYFHPSMIQDPWKQFQLNSAETSTITDKNCENSDETENSNPETSPETKKEDEHGGNNACT